MRSGILKRKLPIAVTEREASFNQDVKAILPDTSQAASHYPAPLLNAMEPLVLGEEAMGGPPSANSRQIFQLIVSDTLVRIVEAWLHAGRPLPIP